MKIETSQTFFPNILIAGTSSGVGKTTISLAIMAALRNRGFEVQGFKVGPDFIDPGYYRIATGRWGRNLDIWMMGRDETQACFVKSASNADISVIEGVMGLYDGKDGSPESSTAGLAKLLGSPALLVIDCSKMGGSAGAIALGYQRYDEEVNLSGFILNNVGSDKHRNMVKRSVENATGLPVLGCIKRDAGISIPERHLGLVTQTETDPSESYMADLAGLAEEYIDLDGMIEIAKVKSAVSPVQKVMFAEPAGVLGEGNEKGNAKRKVKLAVAFDKAFSFYYRDNLDLLEAYGAELVFFSPIEDKHLPENINGIYLGGGYPELYASKLSGNSSLLLEIKEAAESGLPIYAECGGLIYLSQTVEGFDGEVNRMAGVLPIKCKMHRRPILGYREVTAATDSLIAGQGDRLRGHEFHYSSIVEIGNEMNIAYMMDNGSSEGFLYKNTLASYVHLHFAGKPDIAERFVSACE